MSEPNSAPTEDFIIVAEDSKPNRETLVILLKKLGFQVLECEDGSLAWTALEENRDKNIVAVISDLMMPNMDGLELLRRVRNDETYKALPFVLATAVADTDYILEAKNLKVNGYLLKPLVYRRVLPKIQELFPERKFPQLAG